MIFLKPLTKNGENEMDEDGGSPHLLISKALIKNRFENKSPETASESKLRFCRLQEKDFGCL
jgi:hypothetical protein